MLRFHIFTANTPRITLVGEFFAFQVSVKRRSRWYFEGGPGRASSQHAAFHDKFNRHCATLIPPLRFFSPVIGGWLVCWCWECGRFVPCSPKTAANGHLENTNQIWKTNFRLLLSCFYTNHQTQQTRIGNFNLSCLTKLTWAHAILQVSPEIQPIRLPPFCIHSACMAVTLQSQESVAIQLDQDCMT